MNCDELMDILVDYLGEELVIEQRTTVELHIRGCTKCEAYVATYRHTVRITRALPKCGSLPPAVEARLREVIEPELNREAKAG